jgi:soluble lytic murein transglycosylase-like protein
MNNAERSRKFRCLETSGKSIQGLNMTRPFFTIAVAIVLSGVGTASARAAPSPGLSEAISRHAQKAGVPIPLAMAVIRLESNFRPGAVNKGNFGLMQIRLGTARSLGYHGDGRGLLDAETNLTWGMKYLAKAHALARGETCGTIMRYQSGLGAMRMSGANRAYCSKARVLMARS